jgi:hypothetical protein
VYVDTRDLLDSWTGVIVQVEIHLGISLSVPRYEEYNRLRMFRKLKGSVSEIQRGRLKGGGDERGITRCGQPLSSLKADLICWRGYPARFPCRRKVSFCWSTLGRIYFGHLWAGGVTRWQA